jgi:hypothetical protein
MIDRHLMPSSVNRRAFLTKAGMTAAAFSIPRITHARNVSEAESTPLDVAALFEASSLRRPRKSDQSVAKLSYGGGVRRIDRRSWMLYQG